MYHNPIPLLKHYTAFEVNKKILFFYCVSLNKERKTAQSTCGFGSLKNSLVILGRTEQGHRCQKSEEKTDVKKKLKETEKENTLVASKVW